MSTGVPELLLRFTSAGELRLRSVEGCPLEVTGFTAEEFSSSSVSFFDRIHPADADVVASISAKAVVENTGRACLRFRHADGRIRVLQAEFQWRIESHDPLFILRLQTANALEGLRDFQENDARFGVLLGDTGLCVFFKNRNHAFVAASSEFCRLLEPNLAGRELIGLTDYDLLPEADADGFYAAEKQTLQTGAPLEDLQEIAGRNGPEWVFSRYSPLRMENGGVCGLFVSTENITAILRAEEEIDPSNTSPESRRATLIGSYILDVRRGVFATSAHLEAILGVEETYPHTLAGWQGLIHPDDRATVFECFNSALIAPGRMFNIEYRIIRDRDRKLRWVHGLGYIVRNSRGEPLLMRGTVQDITGRKLMETELRETRDRLGLFIQHAPAALAMFDREMRYLAVSRRWLEQEHQTPDIIGKSHLDLNPDLPENFKESYRRALEGQTIGSHEAQWLRADGSVRWERREVLPWREADGSVGGIMLFMEDITHSKKAEERLRLAASVFQHASEGILVIDLNGRAVEVNDAFVRITGYSREEFIGRSLSFLRSPHTPASFYLEMWETLQETGRWHGEAWSLAKNGRTIVLETTLTTIEAPDGKPQYYVGLVSDITSAKDHERQLAHVARHDALTGLANRYQLTEHLRMAMAASQESHRVLAVIYIDLDDFKVVNDHIGREASDALLIQIANQMKQVLREGDILGRLGGDEFVAILPDLAAADSALPIIDRLLRAVADPYIVDASVVEISATAGAAFYPQPIDVDADQLLRQADQTMYEAKLSAKGSFRIFDPVRDSSVRGRNEELNRIRQALKAGEFRLFYQPKVNMATGTLIGAEALIRWQHPQRGLLSPAQFLPVIEEHDLAIEVGEWVIGAALTEIETWADSGYRIPVSVNISARHLQQPDFMDRLRSLLRKHHRVDCTCLELELLETSALHDVLHVSQIMEECRGMGISIAIDDFGTGYSSLSYLKRLPANVLKIDQSFVRDMLEDPDDLAIMQGVLGLASAFRRTPIAEGVETIDHGVLLLKLGCCFAQGYGIARPMPAEEILPWHAQWSPDARWTRVSPVTPLDWSILVAEVDISAWHRALEGYLQGTYPEPPELDDRNCRLAHWLEAEKLGPRGGLPTLMELDRTHQEHHRLAREAVRQHAAGNLKAAHEYAEKCRLKQNAILKHLALLCTPVAAAPPVPALQARLFQTAAKLQ